jgi:predicted DCC family thiol-disulfide oxidoreductase YuxK
VGERFDRWVNEGAFTRTALARYRVVYATVVLLLLPDFSWLAAFPDAMFDPPPGMMRLADGFPPEAVLWGLEAVVAACLVAVLIGWRTRVASLLLVPVAMVGYGYTYSLGKLDHDILLLLVPPALALAGWGDRMSVDALRRRRRGLPVAPERAEQWPLRLLALLVGLAYVTAALPKLLSGWLDPATQVVRGVELRQYFVDGETDYLAHLFAGLDNPVFWELLDVTTIVFEACMVLAVLSWAGTRLWFAIAAVFHFSVLLMLNIPFWHNTLVYGFVVAWDRLRLPRATLPGWLPERRVLLAAPAVVLLGGPAWALLLDTTGDARAVLYPAILAVGAAVGGLHLARVGLRVLSGSTDGASGRLVYDADCGFCTRSALWLSRRGRVEVVPWQAVPDLGALGLDATAVASSAWWLDDEGRHGGSRAIARALVARGGRAPVAVGRLLQEAPVSLLADGVYRVVARHRHRMPGSTEACRVPAQREPGERAPR